LDNKAPDAFRTISEVADELDLPQHVLRFWESRFREIRPMKRGGGRRYYRPADIDLLRGIRHLLYGEGYTIRGVQRILRDQGSRFVEGVWREGARQPPPFSAENGEHAGTDEGFELTAKGEAGSSGPLPLPAGRDFDEVDGVERREPQLTGAPPQVESVGLTHKDRERLSAALEELAACRKLIDDALAHAD
jgi:DNA-binding transcriptional MerR regulator